MIVGVPKEIKNREYRVGLTPDSVSEFVAHGHKVVVETAAGRGVGALTIVRVGQSIVTREIWTDAALKHAVAIVICGQWIEVGRIEVRASRHLIGITNAITICIKLTDRWANTRGIREDA